MEAALKDAENLCNNFKKQNANYEGALQEYRKYDQRNSELDKREAFISERERNQKVFEAELKASAAEARVSEITGLVSIVFRSPVFRTFISENKSVPTDQYNYKNESTTKTIEQRED